MTEWTSLCPRSDLGALSPCSRDLLWLVALPLLLAALTAAPLFWNARRIQARLATAHHETDADVEEREATTRLAETLGKSSVSVRLFVVAALILATAHAHAALTVSSFPSPDGHDSTADDDVSPNVPWSDLLEFASLHRFLAHVVQATLALSAAIAVALHRPAQSLCRPLSVAWSCIPFSALICFTAWGDWRILTVLAPLLPHDMDNDGNRGDGGLTDGSAEAGLVLRSVRAHMVMSVICSSVMLVTAIYRYSTLSDAVFAAALPEEPSSVRNSTTSLLLSTSATPIDLTIAADNKQPKPDNAPQTLEMLASPWQRLTFSWLSPMLVRGKARSLEMADIWLLRRGDTTRSAQRAFENAAADKQRKQQATETTAKAGPLTLQLLKSVKLLFAYQLVTSILGALGDFAGPYFLNRILTYIRSEQDAAHPDAAQPPTVDLSPLRPFFYVFGLFTVATMGSFFNGQAYFTGRRVGTRVRAAIMAAMYAKTLTRKTLAREHTATETAEQKGDGTAADGDKQEDNESESSDQSLDVNVIISTDTRRIVEYVCYIQYLFTTPVQIGVCLFGLNKILGMSAFSGVGLLVIVMPLQSLTGRLLERYQQRVMTATDRRVSKMNEILQGIRVIKFFAWERNVRQLILNLRAVEIRKLTQYWRLMAMVNVLYHIVPTLVTLLTFLTYTKLAGHQLDATKVFTSLSLFNTLRGPLWQLPDQIVRFFETRVSVMRVARYLAQPDMVPYQLDKNEYLLAEQQRATNGLAVMLGLDLVRQEQEQGSKDIDPQNVAEIALINASFEWEYVEPASTAPPATPTFATGAPDPDSDTDDDMVLSESQRLLPQTAATASAILPVQRFQLRDLTIKFPEGGLTIVVGATGSGKTSVLHALLGEMKPLSGHTFFPKTDRKQMNERGLYRGVAYVPQQAWLMNATIRDNILFGDQYNRTLYKSVIRDCALTRDFEILEGGDQTEIGEKGINLSGGQKQRISLARACYNRAQNILLDDVLSAVDAPTAAHIFDNCIAGPKALLAGRTRVLVTHNIGLTAPSADWIVFMKDGAAVAQGPNVNVVKDRVAALGLEELSLFDGVATPLSSSALLAQPGARQSVISDTLVSSVADTNNEEDKPDAKGKGKLIPQSSVATLVGSDDALGDQKSSTCGSDLIDDGGHSFDMPEKTGTKLIEDEQKASGNVSSAVYKAYVEALGGWFWTSMVLMSVVVPQIIAIGQDWWLKNWADAYKTEEVASPNATMALMLSEQVASSLSAMADVQQTAAFLTNTLLMSTLPNSEQDAAPQTLVHAADQQQQSVNVNYYLTVYACLTLLAVVLSYCFTLVEIATTLYASQRLHGDMLNRILRAPISFFDKTPLGRITNRFSKDVQTIDREIMDVCLGFVWAVTSSMSVVALVTFIRPLFIVLFVPVAYAFLYVARYYLASSREIKRWESNTRSPIYSIFGETALGTSVIRAFGARDQFEASLYDKVDKYHRTFFYLWGFNRWLAIRTDFLSNTATLICGLVIVSSRGVMDAGLAGLALSYCLTFSNNCLWVCRMWAAVEIEMNSMERVLEYTQLEQEPPAIIDGNRPPAEWPSRGSIQVNNLSLRYSPDLPPVLKSVSFVVQPREKVGIVGRTGAGKSTLALAFFRFLEASEGSITIDSIDIARIGLEDLRSRLTIIPQDPVLFEGTIRSNLDVFNEYDDLTLWNALKRVHLIQSSQPLTSSSVLQQSQQQQLYLSTMEASMTASQANVGPSITLDSSVSEGGANFSVGQRQLLALARALLRRSKVIVMDESTANVSHDLDAKIQETIRSEFSASSILCIAHRLRTVIDFDRILVLDHGEVREFDTPYNLLQQEDGIFRHMCVDSGEFDHLCHIAENKEQSRRSEQ
ncbi:Transporter of the ATP-binding cassette (ABC) [Sorochytrium milnesiophthora]